MSKDLRHDKGRLKENQLTDERPATHAERLLQRGDIARTARHDGLYAELLLEIRAGNANQYSGTRDF